MSEGLLNNETCPGMPITVFTTTNRSSKPGAAKLVNDFSISFRRSCHVKEPVPPCSSLLIKFLKQIRQLVVAFAVIEVGLAIEHAPGEGLLCSIIKLIVLRHVLINRIKSHGAPLLIV